MVSRRPFEWMSPNGGHMGTLVTFARMVERKPLFLLKGSSLPMGLVRMLHRLPAMKSTRRFALGCDSFTPSFVVS
jgi:hypothetical protein